MRLLYHAGGDYPSAPGRNTASSGPEDDPKRRQGEIYV